MAQKGPMAASEPFSTMFAGFVSLGFMFAWVTFGTSPADASLFIDATQHPLHAIALRAMAGCAFLLLAWRGPALFGGLRAVRLGAVLGVASVALRWCSLFAGPAALVAGGALAGMAYALFLTGWLARYSAGGSSLVVVMLLASFVGDTVYMGTLYLGVGPSRVVLALLPLLAAAVLHAPGASLPAVGPTSAGLRAAGAPGNRGKVSAPFALQVTSLLLCNFASGPASCAVVAGGEQHVVISGAVMFSLAALFTLCGQPRFETSFTLFAVASLLCIAPMPVLDQPPVWLGGLLSGCFWALLLYSIAWFALNDGPCGACPSRLCLVGLGSIYLLSGLAEVVGLVLTDQIACVLALVLVGIALALALVRATLCGTGQAGVGQGPSDGHSGALAEGATAGEPEADLHDASDVPGKGALVAACRVVGERYGLTPGELGVCEYLARGYSLRQVAAELHLSEGAAKYHRHNVYQKCGLSSRQDLINLVESVARDEVARAAG